MGFSMNIKQGRREITSCERNQQPVKYSIKNFKIFNNFEHTKYKHSNMFQIMHPNRDFKYDPSSKILLNIVKFSNGIFPARYYQTLPSPRSHLDLSVSL